MVITVAGQDPRNNDEFYLMIEPTTGGWGAFEGGDGESSLINNVNGSFKDIPVEIFESKYPLQLLSYGVRPDSGGPGKYRGGNGTYREYLVEADSDLFLWFERSKTTAWGLFGGDNGLPPNVIVQRPEEDKLELLKVNGIKIRSGTVIMSLTGGGGGYGLAIERDPDSVRQDAIDGFVSSGQANRGYGVVLSDTFDIDVVKTRERREEMRANC
jgi:N-methylhydantoinase B